MASQYFHVIVIGKQLSGIIAAGLLSKKGARVLLIDVPNYDEDFLPICLPNLEDMPQVHHVHDELGLLADWRHLFHPCQQSLQIIHSQQRCTSHLRLSELQEEWSKAFSQQAKTVRHYLKDWQSAHEQLNAWLASDPALLGRSFWQKMQQYQHMRQFKKLQKNHPYTKWQKNYATKTLTWLDTLQKPLLFWQYLYPAPQQLISSARLLYKYHCSEQQIWGGKKALQQLLLQGIKKAGVHIEKAEISHIHSKNRHLEELRLSDHKHAYRADVFFNSSLAPIEGLQNQQQKVLWGGFCHWQIELPKAWIASAMPEEMILLPPENSKHHHDFKNLPLYVKRKNHRHSTQQSLDLYFCLSKEQAQLLQTQIDNASAEEDGFSTHLRQLLRTIVPYLSNEPLRLQGKPLESIQKYPLYLGDPKKEGLHGLTLEQPWRNVLACDPSLLGGLGLEGEYITGFLRAQQFLKKKF